VLLNAGCVLLAAAFVCCWLLACSLLAVCAVGSFFLLSVLAASCWCLAAGVWLLVLVLVLAVVASCWLLAAGCWLLDAGVCLLAASLPV
jgi:hypothetical protein